MLNKSYSQSIKNKIIQVYVIDREGVEIKKQPDPDAEKIWGATFGTLLEVTKVYNYWYAVKINTPDQIGYVKKTGVTSDETKVPLTNEDLSEVYSDNENEQPDPYPNIEIVLISKRQFLSTKKTSVNYFVRDTSIIKKHKLTIKLPVKKGFKTLVDYPDYNKTDWNTNQYIGQYPSLNKYLIVNCDGESEDCGYSFIDKTTGKSDQYGFYDFPFLSIDKKTIISIQANEYHNYAEFQVVKLNGNKIRNYAAGEFKNWMPAPTDEQFWGNDNCFYVPVIPSVCYHASTYPEKPAGFNYRYIKIKIKGPTVAPPKEDHHYSGTNFDKYYGKRIKTIDSIKKEIELNLTQFTTTKLIGYFDGGDAIVYWKGNELKLVRYLHQNKDKSKLDISIYFKNNQVINKTTTNKITGTQKLTYSEKLYFENGELCVWFDSTEKPMDPGSDEFNNVKNYASESIDDLLKKLNIKPGNKL